MAIRTIPEKIGRFFKVVYLKLFRINDTPQKIALGLGLGVFFGVLPGTGPIAAIFFAVVLRVNRAAALLGSALTNTWLSIPVFIVSLRAGSLVTGARYQDLQESWTALVKDFHPGTLLDLGMYKIALPILIGYAVVSLVIAIISYLTALIIVKYIKRKKRH